MNEIAAREFRRSTISSPLTVARANVSQASAENKRDRSDISCWVLRGIPSVRVYQLTSKDVRESFKFSREFASKLLIKEIVEVKLNSLKSRRSLIVSKIIWINPIAERNVLIKARSIILKNAFDESYSDAVSSYAGCVLRWWLCWKSLS